MSDEEEDATKLLLDCVVVVVVVEDSLSFVSFGDDGPAADTAAFIEL
jgi:hypothetical protein